MRHLSFGNADKSKRADKDKLKDCARSSSTTARKCDMSAAEDELEFDMWDGQFEFFGDSYKIQPQVENGCLSSSGVYDTSVDLIFTSPTNFEADNCDKYSYGAGDRNILSAKRTANMTIEKQSPYANLNQNVQMLQQQMSVLADNQNHSDERYTRAKQENATLQARILMLEEQLREIELRSEEKLIEEEKRHRELVARVDREKQLQVENCAIRLQTLELANESLKEETVRYKNECEIQRKEREKLQDQLDESNSLLISVKQEIQTLREQEKKYKEQLSTTEHLFNELTKEVVTLKNEKLSALAALQDCKETPSQVETELHAQLDSVRQEYKNLQESYEELQAVLLTRSVQEGRNLLTGTNNLAAELEEMTNEDHNDNTVQNELKIKTALKEQQEVNAQLRTYIDTILLNIVENYPQLLEVKGPHV